jgi:2-polyprenyl-6-methoxyphenol hydroxylase-like FAD-dependent oxidoreductase
MRQIGDHAVVLGAGLAGLLAARVLAEAYPRVTVLDRDHLLGPGEHRRGVPQGRHAHILVPGGTQILDRFFPDLFGELALCGVPVVRDFAEFRFSPGGHRLQLQGRPDGPFICQASQPFLEAHMRSRVQALPGVDVMERCQAVALGFDTARRRITGVEVLRRDTGGEETIGADLVVDATGRGSRTPTWLAAHGYRPPRQEQLAINLKYATRHLRVPQGALQGVKVVARGAEPSRPTGFVFFAQEDDQWILTVLGYDGHHPPIEPTDFLAFVEAIAPPDVFAAILGAEPLDDIVAYRFPANLRQHYEKLRRFPTGLLAFGDAICSTNPAYALGMSAAALQAVALHDTLVGGEADLARRFFRAAAKPVNLAWQLAVGADLALPQVDGSRPLPVRVINGYVNRVQRAAERDPVVATQFLRIAALQSPSTTLFKPAIALRVLRANGHRPLS